MKITSTLDRIHLRVRQNRWFRYFTVFNRIALAAGFIPSGFVKVAGERFTDLSSKQPMGAYLEAFHHTGFYYPFVGVMQMTAALLLLIPRTATLGAVIYFPIILNIFVLSMGVRFDGSLVSSPLMVLSCLYLLCWDYHKFKYIFPFYKTSWPLPDPLPVSNKFPFLFFAGVFVTVIAVGATVTNVFNIMPRNTYQACMRGCPGKNKPKACEEFCDCIHKKGNTWEKCLDEYNRAPVEVP